MKKLFIFTAALVMGAAVLHPAAAQETGWVSVSELYYVATGGSDSNHALMQHLLFAEDSLNADVLARYERFQREYADNLKSSAEQMGDQLYGEAIANLEKTIKDNPDMADMLAGELAALKAAQAENAAAAKQNPSKAPGYSEDPAKLLADMTALAVNKKAYTGYRDIGGGLFAVSEAPRFNTLAEDAFSKDEVPEESLYTWGAIDYSGKTVIPFKYKVFSMADPELDFILLRCKDADGNEKCGTKGYDNRIRVPFIYDDVRELYDSVLAMLKDGKYGCIDLDGNLLVPFEYSSMTHYTEGWYVSKDDENYGFLDSTGKTLVPLKYECLLDWASTEEFYMLRHDGLVDVYDHNYKIIRVDKPKYQE